MDPLAAAAAALRVHTLSAAMLYRRRTCPSYFQRLATWENLHEIYISAFAVSAFTLIVSEQTNRVLPQHGWRADKSNSYPWRKLLISLIVSS